MNLPAGNQVRVYNSESAGPGTPPSMTTHPFIIHERPTGQNHMQEEAACRPRGPGRAPGRGNTDRVLASLGVSLESQAAAKPVLGE